MKLYVMTCPACGCEFPYTVVTAGRGDGVWDRRGRLCCSLACARAVE